MASGIRTPIRSRTEWSDPKRPAVEKRLSPPRRSANRLHLAVQICLLCFGLLLSSCSPSIAPFSHAAYEIAVDLKVDALKLMNEAEWPYSDFDKKVTALLVRTEKAYEFAAGRPKNDHSTEQWRRMNDPERNLLTGFFKRWEEEGALSRPFIVEAKTIISRSFDAIIGLESGKTGGDEIE
jgi:hypothetical protein